MTARIAWRLFSDALGPKSNTLPSRSKTSVLTTDPRNAPMGAGMPNICPMAPPMIAPTMPTIPRISPTSSLPSHSAEIVVVTAET